MVFAICMAIWNVVYCLRMCMLDNKLQTFFNLVLFQQLCGREVLWNWFYVFAACERLERYVCGRCEVCFSTTVAWPIFTEIWMTSSLEFDAPARCTSTNKRERPVTLQAQVFGSSYQQPSTPVAEESTGNCVVSPGVRDLLCSLLLGRLTVLDSSCAVWNPPFKV